MFTIISDTSAQELRGGVYNDDPSNGTGSNKNGTREPATIAGYSETKGNIPDYNGNGNHWGWQEEDID